MIRCQKENFKKFFFGGDCAFVLLCKRACVDVFMVLLFSLVWYGRGEN